MPVDTSKSQQHTPEFRAINPNGKVPAIVDTDGPGGAEIRVFDSTAILLYLAEKTGKLMGSSADRGELLSWLFYIGTGLGAFSGQAVHLQRAAPEKLPYAITREWREAERHYAVLDTDLEGRSFIVGGDSTIADISAWGWIDRANFVLAGSDDPLAGADLASLPIGRLRAATPRDLATREEGSAALSDAKRFGDAKSPARIGFVPCGIADHEAQAREIGSNDGVRFPEPDR